MRWTKCYEGLLLRIMPLCHLDFSFTYFVSVVSQPCLMHISSLSRREITLVGGVTEKGENSNHYQTTDQYFE